MTEKIKTVDHDKAVPAYTGGHDWVVELDVGDDGYEVAAIYLDQGERGDASDNGPDLMPHLRPDFAREIGNEAVAVQECVDRQVAYERAGEDAYEDMITREDRW